MATGHKMVMVYPEETPGLLQNDTHTPLSSTKWCAHTHTPPVPTPLTSFSSSKKLTWGNGQGDVKERFEKLTLHSNQH